MPAVIEDDVLVDLVANGVDVVFQAKIGNEAQLVAIKDLGAGIHWCVEQDELGSIAESRCKFLVRQPPFRRLKAYQPWNPSGSTHDRQIGIVERLVQNDFVAGLDQSKQAIAQRLGGARSDQHLRLP